MPRPRKKAQIENYTHEGDSRRNIPTAEVEPVMEESKRAPIALEYERSTRNTDIDPQLVWRGKDEQDWSNLVVTAPPIFIQEKVHPRALINDLIRHSQMSEEERQYQADLFSDFNGLGDPALRSDYYNHEQNWSNRMILGDSLQVMASLANREGLQGRMQCIYIDPPYGLGFNSNFQWSTNSRDVRDGNRQHITREPEQVRAYRDTWRDGIHSYLTYLRDRLTVARDLLTDSGSIFVQIGDENAHRIRAVMDEVFGDTNYVNTIAFKKKSATSATESVFDYILWYCRSYGSLKVHPLFGQRSEPEDETKFNTIVTPPMVPNNVARASVDDVHDLIASGGRWARVNYPIVSQNPSPNRSGPYVFRGIQKSCGVTRHWSYSIEEGLPRLDKAGRLFDGGGASLGGVVFWDDWNQVALSNIWDDIHGEKFPTFVVQTTVTAIQRCILMTTDPGDLVLDPTCGSGTTAYVAEQWGRRWITIDTSRVALALARARIMGARYPYYILADSRDGQMKEAEISRKVPSDTPTYGNVRQGFVYERVPHITLRAIANNIEIDTIYEDFQEKLEPLREALNRTLKTSWEEWEIPKEVEDSWPGDAQALHKEWWELRIARQKEIDASIAAKADFEYLYDKPYDDRTKVRVAGPFTAESLSPHRLIVSGDAEEPATTSEQQPSNGHQFESTAPDRDFAAMILENLRTSGVQQSNKEDKIEFESITGWPGEYICAEGQYTEGENEKRAGIFVGPEFGTVGTADLNAAAREAGRAGFDVLIACAFSYDAHAAELNQLGALPILKARMNADLHMSADLKNTGQGNLFVVFGEPDITLEENEDGNLQVRIEGVDIYDPSTGQVRSDDTDGIACWFIDTDYNEESFFVRHAYFLGANDPYKALKTTLKAEIDADAWGSLNSDISRPFPKPTSGRIAVKVINHLGDEAMKVIRV